MKIGALIYNRLGHELNNQNAIRGPEFDSKIRKPADSSKVERQDRLEESSEITKTIAKDKITLSSEQKAIPVKLSDVLTDNEQAMLQDLFPPERQKWGISAYNNSSFVRAFAVKGVKVDVTT